MKQGREWGGRGGLVIYSEKAVCVKMTGIGMDAATNASVQVDQSQPYGILITNGEFTAFCDVGHSFCPPHTPDGGLFHPVHVNVLPGNQGAVKFITSSVSPLRNLQLVARGAWVKLRHASSTKCMALFSTDCV